MLFIPGVPKFGVRAAVGNTLEDIEKLIKYAHQYWAKVFITMNTILYDNELKEAESLIHELYKLGADALIVQDMGILEMDLPPIELQKNFDDKTLMVTKHCLRYEFGKCPKLVKLIDEKPGPLYLVDNNRKYSLEFNCQRCEMKVVLMPK